MSTALFEATASPEFTASCAPASPYAIPGGALGEFHPDAAADSALVAARRSQARAWSAAMVAAVVPVLAGERRLRPPSLGRTTPLDGTAFMSGASRREDCVAIACMGQPMGITIGAAGPAILERARTHVLDGHRLFVDSGAFREALDQDLSRPTDFEAVFATYHDLVRSIAAVGGPAAVARLTLVMPDRPCHQEESLARLRAYAGDVVELAQAGADLLLPVQGPNPAHPAWGARDATTYWRDAMGIIAGAARHAGGAIDAHRIRPALPCAKGRWPLHAVVDFLAALRPRGVHLLGMGDRSPLRHEWEHAIRTTVPGIAITRDACPFTALLGDGRALTEHNRAANQALRAEIAAQVPCRAFLAGLYTQPTWVGDRVLAILQDALAPDQALPGGADLLRSAGGAPADAAWERAMDRRGWRQAIGRLETIAPDLWDTEHRTRLSYVIDLVLAGHAAAGEADPGLRLRRAHAAWVDSLVVPLGRGIAVYTTVATAHAPQAAPPPAQATWFALASATGDVPQDAPEVLMSPFRTAVLALALLTTAAAVEVPATVASITDGDTIAVTLADQSTAKVRLLYIDTPESRANTHGEAMPEGKLAAEFLDLQAKPGSSVTLWGPGAELARDRYDRLLAVIITTRGDTLQERIIGAGWSPLWEKYGKADARWRDALQAAEDAAAAGKRGAWATAPDYMRNKANETTAPKSKE